jgi:CTP:molybdopterin cytidylyltransferase MocA
MRCAAVVAAAGLGRRAGGPKADRVLPGNSLPLAHRAVVALTALGAQRVIIVGRRHLNDLPTGGISIVPDPLPQAMIDSLRAGRDHLGDGFDGFWFAPVDCPAGLEVVASWRGDLPSDRAARFVWRGEPGHPVWLPRSLWPLLDRPEALAHGAQAVLDGALMLNAPSAAVLDNVNAPQTPDCAD